MVPYYTAATKILKYLKYAPAKGLISPVSSSLKFTRYVDSDWARCHETRKPITGYCMFIGSSLISWKSKKQNIISRSSTKAEYGALASLTCEIQYLQYLFQDLKIKFSNHALVFCDSKFAIYLAHNPIFHERSKHIELDYHVIREKIQSQLIHLLHIPNNSQIADMFTKLYTFQFYFIFCPSWIYVQSIVQLEGRY